MMEYQLDRVQHRIGLHACVHLQGGLEALMAKIVPQNINSLNTKN